MMTELVGILNLTPDSFSDGGAYVETQKARIHILAMQQAGAFIIDVGAESTRPGATILTPEEEWQRLAALMDVFPYDKVKLSVDTRHAETVWHLREGGYPVHWVNDVSAAHQPELIKEVVKAGYGYVLMHSLSIPADPEQVLPDDVECVEHLLQWAEEKIRALMEMGLKKQQIVFDPGIGFGKKSAQNWELIRSISRFKVLGVPLFVGHSRKSFLSDITDKPAVERDVETAMVTQFLANQEVDYVRVHDVAMNGQAVKSAQRLYNVEW